MLAAAECRHQAATGLGEPAADLPHAASLRLTRSRRHGGYPLPDPDPGQPCSGFRRILRLGAADLMAPGARRPIISCMTHFVPAAFDLYEFDDDNYPMSSDRTAQCWFSSFNGRIGQPPQNVTLAWSDGICTVMVRTDEHPPWNTADARKNAAHVALGGTALLPQRSPFSPTNTNAEISRIATAERLWSRTSGVLPEGPDAQTIIWDEFALGYLELDNGAVFIAATHLDPHEFKIRKV